MVEIKFRAKAVPDGGWVYGEIVHKPNSVLLYPSDGSDNVLVYPETIGQFSGLHDKNGNEIYEGDIVEFRRFPENRRKSVLTRHVVTCVSVVEWKFKSLTNEVLPLLMLGQTDWDSYKYDVIGNIYDNPELNRTISLNLQEPKPRKKRAKSNIKLEFVVKEDPRSEETKRTTKVAYELSQEQLDELINQTIK